MFDCWTAAKKTYDFARYYNTYAKEVIKNSQDKTAKIFNADKTIYLVNGTTCGIEAAIMATCNPKSKIIMNRDCHQSVINACILGDLEPIYIQTQICRKTNIIQGVNIEDVIKTIDSNLDAKAIILTYPTYYGTTYDLKSICEYAHSKDMVVIIDEAHGAHLELSNRLPKSAIIQGADIIVQSTHKTLPAFTQASMLHIKGNRVDEKKILSMLRFLESSSPSYLLLNSLELAVDIYEKHGHELMENLLNTIEEFKASVGDIKKDFKIEKITLLGNSYKFDLEPKDDGEIETISLWIDKKSLLVNKLFVKELGDNTITFELKDIVLNKNVTNDNFIIQIPKGFDLIDNQN